MNFSKYQALGNDFLITEDDLSVRPKLVQYLLDRHFGIGADGLIIVKPSASATAKMDFFNSDGSKADVCGNGLRCLALFLKEANLKKADELTIETESGIKRVSFFNNKISVNMGRPNFKAAHIPVKTSLEEFINQPIKVEGFNFTGSAVSMGNPHLVIIDDIDEPTLELIGPKIENMAIFPNKTNVEFVKIKVKVWERGVGKTLACGTGACASLAVAIRNGLTENKATIELDGGSLEVELTVSGEIDLTGEAKKVFDGQVKV